MDQTIYQVVYEEDGTIQSIGSIDPRFYPRDVKDGYFYTTQIPEEPDIINNYKIQNGIFVFDPRPVKTPEPEEYLSENDKVLRSLMNAQNDTDALAIDQEYRLTLLELGI